MELRVGDRTVFAATSGRDFDPERPTCLFVHGAGMDHSVWTLQARYVAHHGANALAIDLPGHGRSEGPPDRSIEAMAAGLAALIEALGCARVRLIGHSMGALICLQAAADRPEQVDRLALLGVAPLMPVHPALLDAAAADQPLARALVVAWGHGPAGHVGGNRAPGGWLMGQALRLLEKAGAGVLHNDLAACDAYRNAVAAAGAVRCPTLIIAGRQDRMTPAREAAKLAAAIADARLVTLDGAGHLMMVEKPEVTLDLLIAACSRAPTGNT